jgi:hypothetical protein
MTDLRHSGFSQTQFARKVPGSRSHAVIPTSIRSETSPSSGISSRPWKPSSEREHLDEAGLAETAHQPIEHFDLWVQFERTEAKRRIQPVGGRHY